MGYIRVSTTNQNTDRQLDGVELDRVFTDKASGKNADRDALKELLAYVREGDTVVVHSLDRLGRSLGDLLELVSQITGKGITVRFVQEDLVFSPDTNNPMSNLLLGVMGSFAQFERAVMLERQREGIQKAREQGRYQGRVLALSPDQVEELRTRAANGENKSALAREYGISRPVLYDYLNNRQAKLKTPRYSST
ncbi:recombinase family protein [Deinococcus radiophilus]|uniref:recombinase family protein n=1 Tax=Deinococcus radiophilus TaxID=32062 RepID=UPI001F29DF19|nr:recombinase family protein [Deinococcus radiophilus]